MGCMGSCLGQSRHYIYEGGKACVKVGQSETEMFDVFLERSEAGAPCPYGS